MRSLALILTVLMISPDSTAQTPMRDLLPSSIRGWNIAETPRSFPGRSIFEYMDGAGEIYLAYNFRDLLVCRYAFPGQEEILVEVFDMGASRNAFGVFTYMKGRGPAVPIGQDGEYRSGLLCFWKSSYFVCVKIENENEEAKRALLDLGTAVSERIRESGERPDIVGLLPEEEYLPNTLRYFFTNEMLNIHFYVADANLLRLDGTTECLLVRLKREKSHLLLVRYAREDQASAALAEFRRQYMPEAKGGSVKTENGKWTATASKKSFVLVLFDSPAERDALTTLENVKRRLP